MADVAALSFAIDSSDARRARQDLDGLKLSASEVAEAQVRFNRAVAEGRDPVRALRAEMELFQRDTLNAQRGIEGLVDRLNQLTMALSAGSGSVRELRQTVGQIEAAAAAFNTTAIGMEMFVRTSRSIGISSQETTGALRRIEDALRGVSEEGARARAVLRDYGVSTDGRAGDAASVLREFTERLRQYRMDSRTGSDIQAVFGPMSTAGIAALRDPEFRTEGQRQREIAADATARRVAELRNGLVFSRQERERSAAEMADLEREYGWNDSFGRGLFQSDASRRRELEERRASGAQSRSAYERSDAYLTDPYRYGAVYGNLVGGSRMVGRGLAWLGSDEFSLRSQTIAEDAMAEYRDADSFLARSTVGFREAGRQIQNLFGRGDVTPRRDTRPVNERTAAYDAETEMMAARGFMLPANLARQQSIIEAARAFGTDRPEFAGMLPQDILAELSPGQRAAIERRETSAFQVGTFRRLQAANQRGRALGIERFGASGIGPLLEPGADAGYGLGEFAGGANGSEADGERARRVAQIIVSAEDEIADARRRGIRIRQEVEALDRQLDERRATAAREAARRTGDAEEEIALIRAGGSAQGTGASIRAFRAFRGSQQIGGTPQADALRGDFAQEQLRVERQLMTARRQGEQQEYLLGGLRSGRDPQELADSLQVNQQLAGMREAAEAVRRTAGETSAEYAKMLRDIRDAEVSIRAQLQAERDRTAEIAAQNQAARTGATLRENFLMGGDATVGERTQRRMRNQIAQQMGMEAGLIPRDAPNAAELADGLMNGPNAAFQSQVNARLQAEMERQREEMRLEQEARRRRVRAGGTGNPIEDQRLMREAQREELRGRYSTDPILQALELGILEDSFLTEDRGRANAPIVGSQQRAAIGQARLQASYGGIRLSERDLDYGARVIATEEGTRDGRLGVAATILNRVLAGNYGGSNVADVVSARGQFEPWSRGIAQALPANDPRLAQAREMLEGLVSGRYADPTGGATYFYGINEMARRGTHQNHRWMVNPDGSLRSGVDISGTRFLTAPDAAAAGARARLYGPDADLAAAAAGYTQQNPNGDVGAFTAAQVQERVTESMERFRQQMDRGTLQFEELSRAGLTPFQRGLADAIEQVRPLTENLRRLAARPETTAEQRVALLGRAQALEDQQRDLYIGRLRSRDPDERQRLSDEREDLELQSSFGSLFRSSASIQREVGENRLRRQLNRTRSDLSSSEIESRVREYGANEDLREQARTMGMLRDGWYQVGNAAGRALETIIMRGGTAKQVVSALLAEMASYYLRVGSRAGMDLVGRGITGLFNSLFGGGGASTAGIDAALANGVVDSSGAILPYAQGGLLDSRAWAKPMAQGGVYAHAQYVPMANGGSALVGEAGPEAAVPLVRMPSGNLGVRAGGGVGSINQNITVNVGAGGAGGGGGMSPAQIQMMANEIRKAARSAADDAIRDNTRIGGMLNPSYGRSM